MHILLMILKITGIILLVILGLLLTLILLILLVPLRYRIQASYRKAPAAAVRITWLFRAVSVLVTYDGEPDAAVKIFGMPIFRLRSPGGDGEGPEAPEEPEMPETVEEAEAPEEAGTVEEAEAPEEPEMPETVEEAEAPEEPEEPETVEVPEEPEEPETVEEPEEPAGRPRKAGSGILKILEDPDTQDTLRLLWKQLKRLVLHVIPTKASGSATLGFDDPAVTGRVLAACSVLYALYGDDIVITPDFENSVLEGDLDLKGRIRVGTIVFCAVRVLMDRGFRVTLKRIKKYRESGGI